MKIVPTAFAAALLFGIGAFMHPTSALALAPCSACDNLLAECDQGNQAACRTYESACRGCRKDATVSGTPPAKRSNDAGTAMLNSHRPVSSAK